MLGRIKSFILSKPPVVIFIISTLFFASVFLFLCPIISHNDIRVHAALKDWNLYLEKFASLHFCIKDESIPSEEGGTFLDEMIQNQTDFEDVSTLEPDFVRHQMILQLEVQHANQFKDIPFNSTSFKTSINPQLLEISANHKLINLSTTLHHSWQHSKSSFLTSDVTRLQACVTFQGHHSLFPPVSRSNGCDFIDNKTTSGVYYNAVQMEAHKLDGSALKRCHGNLKVRLVHTPEPLLNVYLSTREKEAIIKRILKTSLSLIACVVVGALVMVVFNTAPPNQHKESEDTHKNLLVEESEDL